MQTYKLVDYYSASKFYTVEADSEEEALEKGKQMPDLDLSDITDSIEYIETLVVP